MWPSVKNLILRIQAENPLIAGFLQILKDYIFLRIKPIILILGLHAEQQIRPDVIFRKITFGNRSQKGAANHSILQSIIQTARLNGIDCPGILREVLCGKDAQRKKLFSSIRSP